MQGKVCIHRVELMSCLGKSQLSKLNIAPKSFLLHRGCLIEYSTGASISIPPPPCNVLDKTQKSHSKFFPLRRAAQRFCGLSRWDKDTGCTCEPQVVLDPFCSPAWAPCCPCWGGKDGFPNQGQQAASQLRENQYCC